MKGVGYFEGVRLIELAQTETENAQSTFHTHYKFRLNFRYGIASCNVKIRNHPYLYPVVSSEMTKR